MSAKRDRPDKPGVPSGLQGPVRAAAGDLLRDLLRQRFSNLYHALHDGEETEAGGLSLRQRSPGDWFCVVRRGWHDGRREVAFGSGSTPWAALVAVSGSIAAGKWRPDKYPPLDNGRE